MSAAESSSSNELQLVRIIRAAPEKVYRAWTDPEGDHTRYTARALHWTAKDKKAHEEMGFHEGWGKATDQLAALVEAS